MAIDTSLNGNGLFKDYIIFNPAQLVNFKIDRAHHIEALKKVSYCSTSASLPDVLNGLH